jgi:hypothetical protein
MITAKNDWHIYRGDVRVGTIATFRPTGGSHRQHSFSRATDNTTLLHWSYSNAAIFLPWLISAGRFGQRGDWLGSAHLRRGHVPSRQFTRNSVFR